MNLDPKVKQLLTNGWSISAIARARKAARLLVPGFPANGCAAFLGSLMRLSGIDVPKHVGAEELAESIHARGWERLEYPGHTPQKGDIGVTVDLNGNGRADHIYLVLDVNGAVPDALMIIDNQRAAPHLRSAGGKDGKTPTDYFLRAPSPG